MAKGSFEEFRGNLTEDDLAQLVTIAKKKRKVYLLAQLCGYAVAVLCSLLPTWIPAMPFYIGLIPMVAVGICAGLGIYTHNMICFIASRGHRDGGGIGSIIWMILSGIIIPLIVIVVCNRTFPWKSVLGWGKTDISFV